MIIFHLVHDSDPMRGDWINLVIKLVAAIIVTIIAHRSS